MISALRVSAPRRASPLGASLRKTPLRNEGLSPMPKIGDNRGPEMQQDIDILLALMRAVEIDTLINYSEFSAAVGRPIKSSDTALRAAIKTLIAEKIVFGNVSAVGYRRLPDDEVAGERARRRMLKPYRASRRALKELDTVNDANLDQSVRPLAWARRAVHQTIIKAAHGNAVNRSSKREEEKNHLLLEMQRRKSEVDKDSR